jgi:hypothetical protein
MRKVSAFKAWESWEQLPYAAGISSPLDKAEQILGVYENKPGSIERAVVFTTNGVHLQCGGHWRSISFGDIEKTLWPDVEKDEVRALTLKLRSGELEFLPGKSGDVFVMMRFFDRVLSDLREVESS